MFQRSFDDQISPLHSRTVQPGLVVVSNRLPVICKPDGSLSMSSGGLVSALHPVLSKRGGLWIGWTGSDAWMGHVLHNFSRLQLYDLQGVFLSQEEIQKFYYGFCNQTLWPLFHGFPEKARFDEALWRAYQAVNRKFARKVAGFSDEEDWVWVHDYHLLTLARQLKELGVYQDVAFYLHIPFPAPDIFCRLPWREELLLSLLEFKLIGFQTIWDLENFCKCVALLAPGDVKRKDGVLLSPVFGGEETRIGVFPIGIDWAAFSGEEAVEPKKGVTETGSRAHAEQQIMLGVDRLDYSKGIPERLLAFEQALSDYPDLCERLVLEQVVVPSRQKIQAYQQVKETIESLVARINGKFSTLSWTPVRYVFQNLERSELLKAYKRADIALVTPLRDGMNLVAKEFCAAKSDLNGVLILSEFAGAAIELHDACLLVNPYDIQGMAATIHEACHLPFASKARLMQRARHTIRQRDVHWWQNEYLKAAFAGRDEKTSGQANQGIFRSLKNKIWQHAVQSPEKNRSAQLHGSC